MPDPPRKRRICGCSLRWLDDFRERLELLLWEDGRLGPDLSMISRARLSMINRARCRVDTHMT
jgi:hypothetical protein